MIQCEGHTSTWNVLRSARWYPAVKPRYNGLSNINSLAFADGNVDKYEEYVIRKVSDLIYISHPDFIESKQKARGEYENRKT